MSAFNYCSIIWMFCNKTSNGLIDRAQKRALRVVYDHRDLSLAELLQLSGTVSVHTKNLRQLMTEIYKTQNYLNPSFMQEIFPTKTCRYPLRGEKTLILPRTSHIRHGTNSFTFRGCLTWNKLPNHIKNSATLTEFKTQIKKWGCDKCGCSICVT